MLSDKEVIEKINKGEINFFEIIVKKYLLNISKLVKSKISSIDDVDDIIQNVFIKLYKNIHKLNKNLPVLPYLYQIAKNEIKMYFRSKKNEISLNEKFHLLTDSSQNIGEEFINGNYLKHLKKEERKMLMMVMRGFSYKEISQVFKKPLNTVKSIIRRARKKIKNFHNGGCFKKNEKIIG